MATWRPLPGELAEPARRLAIELRRLKDLTELSLARLGEKTNYSASSWERWLNGRRQPPRAAVIRIAQICGCDPDPLLALWASAVREQATHGGGSGDGTAHGRQEASAGPQDAGSGHAAPAVPAQLPADVPAFTGRAEHLARLDALLAAVVSGERAAVVIAALSGTAGVGKTALAVHWAHRAAGQFPDGQLYVNLRGFGGGERVMAPAEAVRGFLDALGVLPERIPPSLDQQTALYRSLLAGKRMLVVLDNARDADQVRPLLPGSAGMVLVTSRDQLTPLVAAEGAQHFSLGILSIAEATELLASRVGAGQVAAEPGATGQIIGACARLPLALSIAAARAQQTGFPLAAIAAELASADQSQGMMDAADVRGQIRAVLSWSYVTLTPAAARLFRLLGLRRGPDFSVAVAASLGGHTRAETRLLLAELTRASLLTEHLPARYSCHDLLHAYAAELTGAHDSHNSRHAALTRLLDYYLHTAYQCDLLIQEHRDPAALPLTPAARGACPERPADRRQALGWLIVGQPVLLAAVRLAAEAGFDTHAWQLAWVLHSYLTQRGHWDALSATWQIALDAARRLGDTTAQATAHSELAAAQIQQGRYADGHRQLSRALALHEAAGDVFGQAHAHCHLMDLLLRQGRYTSARDHAQQMLALFLAAGHCRGQAHALNNLGWCHAHLGNTARALDLCRQGISLFQQLGDHDGEASTWDTLGRAYHFVGAFTEAVGCFQRALELIRNITNPYTEAEVLTHLGDAHQALANSSAARAAWNQALAILTGLNHPQADELSAKLSNLDRETA